MIGPALLTTLALYDLKKKKVSVVFDIESDSRILWNQGFSTEHLKTIAIEIKNQIECMHILGDFLKKYNQSHIVTDRDRSDT